MIDLLLCEDRFFYFLCFWFSCFRSRSSLRADPNCLNIRLWGYFYSAIFPSRPVKVAELVHGCQIGASSKTYWKFIFRFFIGQRNFSLGCFSSLNYFDFCWFTVFSGFSMCSSNNSISWMHYYTICRWFPGVERNHSCFFIYFL